MTDTPLRHAVLDRLDMLDRAMSEGAPEVRLPIARYEMHRLTEALRALLADHEPDSDGRCPTCPGTLRGRPWPCKVWQAAHRHLITGRSAAIPQIKTSRHTTRVVTSAPAPSEPEVPVIAQPIVASTGPGPSDWDTDEFIRPDLTTGATPPPPLTERLETDHSKIYRAAVVNLV